MSKRKPHHRRKSKIQASAATKAKQTTPVRARATSRLGITAPVTITAQAGDSTTRRFRLEVLTGEPLYMANWPCPMVVDLDTIDLSQQRIPALYDHWADESSIVGQVESMRIEGPNKTPPLIAEGIFTPRASTSAQSDYARAVIERADAGYQWQVSIGGDPASVEEVTAGNSVIVNGRSYAGPVLVARGVVLREISFVVIGADRRTTAVVASGSSKGANMTFEEWLTSMGFDADAQAALSDIQRANLKIQYDKEYPAEPTTTANSNGDNNDNPANANGNGGPVDEQPVTTAGGRRPAIQGTGNVERLRSEAAAELTRQRRVREIAASYGNPEIEITANGRAQRVPLIEHAISAGLDTNGTELLALRASRPAPNINVGAGRGEHIPQIIETAMAIKAGLAASRIAASLPSDVRERVMNEASSSRWAGFGLWSLMDETIHAAGMHFHGVRNSMQFIRAAMEADRRLQATVANTSIQGAGGFGTVSLSGILSNLANKGLIEGYTAVNTTWSQFCAVRPHNDFKVHTRYRLDVEGNFRKVGPDGELKQVKLSEASYTNRVETFGAIISLTRQMFLNDDLGAFMEIPTQLGRACAIRIEEGVYALLLSNPGSFFHTANNGNLITGSGTALSLTSLTQAEAAMMDQVDSSGKPILVSPSILLVGSLLKAMAESIFKEGKITISGDTDRTLTADNPHVGKYRPVASPYLNNTALRDQDGVAFSGQSATQWFLFASPEVRAAIAVAFLNGAQQPTIEMDDMPFTTLGYQWRAYHDFGVGMEDPKAALKSAGA